MKKVLFLVAFAIASLYSAKNVELENKCSFQTSVEMIGGYCPVSVYRVNGDGSSTYIGTWSGYADSQEDCNKEGRAITALLQMGVEPGNVLY